jgi:WD domain, G-beta repeat
MWMRWGIKIAVCALALAPAAATVQAASKREAPVAVVGNFFGPADAEELLFSPDDKIVVAPGHSLDLGSELTLWEVASGLPLRALNREAFFTASLFTPSGTTVVSGHKDGVIELWDVASGRVLATMRHKPREDRDDAGKITSLWLDAKGELLVSGDSAGVVNVWRLGERRSVLSVKTRVFDKLGNAPQVLAARLTADGARLIVLGRAYNKADSVTIHDAHSGAELSSFDLPADHKFLERGYLDDTAVMVEVSGANCEIGELMLFGLRERATVASVHKPAVCAKPKEGEPPAPEKVFSSPGSTLVVVTREAEPDALVWDVKARRLVRTIHWPGPVGAGELIGVSRDLKFAATHASDGIRIRALDSGAPVSAWSPLSPDRRSCFSTITPMSKSRLMSSCGRSIR